MLCKGGCDYVLLHHTVNLKGVGLQERRLQEQAERLIEIQKEEAQAQALVRRQFKDSLIWLKGLARDPLENPVLRYNESSYPP